MPVHTAITLDLIYLILKNSLLHPFIAALIPFCLRATSTPTTSPKFQYACLYAVLISLLWMLSAIDYRIAYGKSRTLNWDEEVVVITGGARGLGRILAQTFEMRGASVAVLDVKIPAGEEEGEGKGDLRFYRCDVSDTEAVEKVKAEIERDLGNPTILINNAATLTGKPLLLLTPSDLHRTISVNLLSHFTTLRAFLPGMLASPTGGTILTIASVLGKLGAANLSDYTASKAGLIAMHRSLVAELSLLPQANNIRTVLVTPGQLGTKLFEGVQTPSPFFGPVVEPVELAREIVSMIDSGMSGEISLPLYARWIDWMFVLPVGVQRLARWVSGVDRAMEGWKGGEKKAV